MRSSALLALTATFSAASALYQGFNYGSTQTDGSVKDSAAFEAEFKAAKALAGTNGAFTSARLYTTIQGGTAADPISAIQAAIDTDTTLLLGMWASSGQATIDSEISALKSAIATYGTKFTSLVAGISIGSEDLYRISPTGILNKSGAGAGPADLVSYIKAVRAAIAGTSLSGAKIGHVDTWTAWVNGSNADVINNCDWLGVDAYPYFQNTESNGIESGPGLFFDAYDATVGVAGGKDVWITETGWPVSGSTENLAVPSLANAKTYWDQVGCLKSFGKINTFWFTLQDAFPTTPNPSFGLVGTTLSSTPLFDLSCAGVSAASSSQSEAVSSSKSSSATSDSSGSIAVATSTSSSGLTPTQGGNASSTAASNASGTASGTGAEATASGSGGMVTSTTGGSTSASGAAPSSSKSASASGNAASSFHSGSFLGGALGAVCVVAALL